MFKNWSEATQNPFKAIKSYIGCLQAGNLAHIALINNSVAAHPIRIKNPALELHDNWTSSYGVPFDGSTGEYNFFNDTEEDLTYNYKYVFNAYRCRNGHLFHGKSTDNCPECGCDFKETSQECGPELLKYPAERAWVTFWKPKRGMPYWIPKPLKRRVFVILIAGPMTKRNWRIKLISLLTSPLKYIPKKDVLEMPKYKVYTFRVGGIDGGYYIKFQIPKKFLFN